jgi:nucleoid-associated protein YgaU
MSMSLPISVPTSVPGQPSGKLEKAFLSVKEPSSSGAIGAGSTIHFMFNPKEFTLARTATWAAKPSKKATMPEFVGTRSSAMTVEMFFDSPEGSDVQKEVEKLLKCMDPYVKTENKAPCPPFVSLGWGKKTYLDQAVVKSVSVKYTRFNAQGEPIRAVATVTLEELQPTLPSQNPTSGSLDAEVERVVRPGDSLALIAYEELGSAARWRAIAEVNRIDDPFRLAVGTRLIIPTLTARSDTR